MKRNARLIWRGALGGALGAPFFLIGFALHEKLRIGYVPYGGGLQLIALPTFLLAGTVFGTLIGGIIWVVVAKVRSGNLPAIVRAIIGSSFILFVLGVFQLRSEVNSGLVPPTPIEVLVNVLLYIGSFGALPGIAARPIGPKQERKIPRKQRHRNKRLQRTGISVPLIDNLRVLQLGPAAEARCAATLSAGG